MNQSEKWYDMDLGVGAAVIPKYIATSVATATTIEPC